MQLKTKKIYSGNTLSNDLTITDNFNNSNIVFIIPNGLTNNEGYEIAYSLLINLQISEMIGGVPIITGYGEKEVNLDTLFFDTGTILKIPDEVVKQGLNCKIIFATSYPINIDVYAISLTEISNEELNERLNEIIVKLNSIETNQSASNIAEIILPIALNLLTAGNFPLINLIANKVIDQLKPSVPLLNQVPGIL